MQKKEFDRWNSRKKQIDKKQQIPFFHEGDVWWVHLGINIGVETDGKDEYFSRPVLIVKKYNHHSFLALPLSTTKKRSRYHLSIGKIDGEDAAALLSQLRNIDSHRLIKKIAHIEKKELDRIRQETSRINFN